MLGRFINRKSSSSSRSKRGNKAVAVIGMSCRFPGGANSIPEYWELLKNAGDGTSEVPADRYSKERHYHPQGKQHKPYTKRAGFLTGIDIKSFDAGFFRMSPREVTDLDPQQRLLLETSVECFENAAIPMDSVINSDTGVYVGISSNDYSGGHYFSGDPSLLSTYSMLGTMMNTASGRVAYVLGLRGPTMSVDTACSASLTSLHLAVQAIRNGECKMALAGGVNILLNPIPFTYLCLIGALSKEGRCRSFDAEASGYARAEGCGMVLLKDLSQAEMDGDRILGIIRGSAVNHDGASPGLTVPSPEAQKLVMRKALEDAGIPGSKVSYVEAHGTGTPTGDPIEMTSIGEIYSPEREKGAPLWVGSVKSNFGHLESAAGIASVIKVILALRKGILPPNLHFHNPNPVIPWKYGFQIPTRPEPLRSKSNEPMFAAASSFGISGTNGHIILEAVPEQSIPASSAEKPHWMLLSANSGASLQTFAADLAHTLRMHPDWSLESVCAELACGRQHYSKARIAIAASTLEDATRSLEALAKKQADSSTYSESNPPGVKLPQCGAILDWLRGQPIEDLYVRRLAGSVQLPHYKFDREEYWLDPNAHLNRVKQSSGESADWLLSDAIESPDGTRLFRRTFQQGGDAFMEEHQIMGLRVLPAALFVKMAEAAAKSLLEEDHVELRDIQFGGTVILAEDEKRTLLVKPEKKKSGWVIEIWSRKSDTADSPWLRHFKAQAHSIDSATKEMIPSLGLSARKIIRQLGDSRSRECFYQQALESGFAYRGKHRLITELRRGPGQSAALLEPGSSEILSGPASVGILDSCFQTCLGLYWEQNHDPDKIYVTVSISRYFANQEIDKAHLAWFRLKRNEGEVLVGDLHIVDKQGDLVALFQDCCAQRLPADRIDAVNEAGQMQNLEEIEAIDTLEFYHDLLLDEPEAWHASIAAMVARTVAEVLKIRDAGTIDHSMTFRDLGFDSLVNAQFIGALSISSDIDLPLSLYMEHPSVNEVTSYLISLPEFSSKVLSFGLRSQPTRA